MALFEEDLTKVQESEGFKYPGAGVYCMKIVRATHVAEKQRVEILMDYAYGEFKDHAAKTEEHTGQDWAYIKGYLSYKPTALGLLARNIKIIAESSKVDINELKSSFNRTDGQSVVGKYVGIVIGQQEYRKNDGKIGKRFGFPTLVNASDAKNHPEKFEVPALIKLQADDDDEPVPEEAEAMGERVIDDDVPF